MELKKDATCKCRPSADAVPAYSEEWLLRNLEKPSSTT